MPKISVIVPVYKVEQYLHKCVDSILNQTFSDFELILVDDGSPDNCGNICDEYAERDNRVVVIHKENGGLSDARNAGLDWVFSNSDSDYIGFVDSDDWVDQRYFELLYNALIKNNADLAICDLVKISENDGSVINANKNSLANCFFNGARGYVDMLQNWKLVVSVTKLYKRSIFKSIRYPIGRLHEDEYIIHRIFHECNTVVTIKDKLYFYLQRPQSIMHDEKMLQKRREDTLGYFKDRCEFFFNIGETELYKYWLLKYLNRFAANVREIHATKTGKKLYETYNQSFKKELKRYKKYVKENYYNILLRSVDRCNFDFKEKIKYVVYALHTFGFKKCFKKALKLIFKRK